MNANSISNSAFWYCSRLIHRAQNQIDLVDNNESSYNACETVACIMKRHCLSFSGGGMGLMFVGSLVRLQSYFLVYRTSANGLFACGAGIGTAMFGPILTESIIHFGWRNALRILVNIHAATPR